MSDWRTDPNGNQWRFCCDCAYIEAQGIPQRNEYIKILEGLPGDIGKILWVTGAAVHGGCVVPVCYSNKHQKSFPVLVRYEQFYGE